MKLNVCWKCLFNLLLSVLFEGLYRLYRLFLCRVLREYWTEIQMYTQRTAPLWTQGKTGSTKTCNTRGKCNDSGSNVVARSILGFRSVAAELGAIILWGAIKSAGKFSSRAHFSFFSSSSSPCLSFCHLSSISFFFSSPSCYLCPSCIGIYSVIQYYTLCSSYSLSGYHLPIEVIR